jgi:hypothetical protein
VEEETMTTEEITTTEKDPMKTIEVTDLTITEIEISEKTKEITEEDTMTIKIEVDKIEEEIDNKDLIEIEKIT